jgi:hypothetical protein
MAELDVEPVDAGPLTCARYIEPAGMLVTAWAGANIGNRISRVGESAFGSGLLRVGGDCRQAGTPTAAD